MSASGPPAPPTRTDPWAALRPKLRDRGLRWTPQRRLLVGVLSETSGHITGNELVDRCRELDPNTIPSTVYRTLDVLEELGYVTHAHGADGREEYHVLPASEHGHLHCSGCGQTWEIEASEAAPLAASLQAQLGFQVDLTHLSVSGRCAECAGSDRPLIR